MNQATLHCSTRSRDPSTSDCRIGSLQQCVANFAYFLLCHFPQLVTTFPRWILTQQSSHQQVFTDRLHHRVQQLLCIGLQIRLWELVSFTKLLPFMNRALHFSECIHKLFFHVLVEVRGPFVLGILNDLGLLHEVLDGQWHWSWVGFSSQQSNLWLYGYGPPFRNWKRMSEYVRVLSLLIAWFDLIQIAKS